MPQITHQVTENHKVGYQDYFLKPKQIVHENAKWKNIETNKKLLHSQTVWNYNSYVKLKISLRVKMPHNCGGIAQKATLMQRCH